MAFTYRFVGELPRVFSHLTHGPTVSVVRDGSTLLDDEGEQLDHTVELEPGDLLTVGDLQEHAELDPADPATVAAHAALAPEQLPTKKADLQELARSRDLDDSGTVAELTARLS